MAAPSKRRREMMAKLHRLFGAKSCALNGLESRGETVWHLREA
jgi:hypothetical protein